MAALSGIDTIKTVRKRQDKTLLAFSTGKDSVAAWLAIRDHFDEVVPYYLYAVPDLEFVEESIQYYEDWFGVKVTRLPHPSLYRWLNSFTFQAPENLAVIEDANLPNFDYEHIRLAMIEKHGLDKNTLVADGVRAADSPMRRVSIMTHGSISDNQMKYHPVWDWKKKDMLDCFKKHDIKLSKDYRIFGRSFDGVDLRFLYLVKQNYPRDYQRILEWLPLADLEIFRWEKRHGYR